VIVGGGVLDPALLGRLAARGSVVAADGGADVCLEAGIMPDAVIGDMDSISDLAAWRERTKVFRLDEQDTPDFEKCLYSTRAPVTVALGMTGGRLDHTLAALDSASRYAADRHILFADTHDLALAVSGDISLVLEPGERFSVHPLGDVTFARSSGLEYPLDGLTLSPGTRTGTSNAATRERVEIDVAPGEQSPYLVLIELGHLDNLLETLAARR